MEDVGHFGVLVEDAMRKVERSLSLPFIVRCKSPKSVPPRASCVMLFRSEEDKAIAERRRGEIEAALVAELKQSGFSIGAEVPLQIDLQFEIVKKAA